MEDSTEGAVPTHRGPARVLPELAASVATATGRTARGSTAGHRGGTRGRCSGRGGRCRRLGLDRDRRDPDRGHVGHSRDRTDGPQSIAQAQCTNQACCPEGTPVSLPAWLTSQPPAVEFLQRDGNAPWRSQGAEQQRGLVAEGSDGITLAAAEGTTRQVALDHDATRPAQCLVEICVQFILKNVRHRPHDSSDVRVPRRVGAGRGRASYQSLPPPNRTARQSPDNSCLHPTATEPPGPARRACPGRLFTCSLCSSSSTCSSASRAREGMTPGSDCIRTRCRRRRIAARASSRARLAATAKIQARGFSGRWARSRMKTSCARSSARSASHTLRYR